MNDHVFVLKSFAGDLYAGGSFTVAGGVSANHVAKWDGASWSALGSGTGEFVVMTLCVFDDGLGPALFAGGEFTTAGGVVVNNIAKWTRQTWSGLNGGTNAVVRALTVFDDGTGASLFVGGDFTVAGGVSTQHIAKWNGSEWAAVHSGVSSPVHALISANDGTGQALFVGGNFSSAGGQTAHHIAKWRCCPAPAGAFNCDSDVDLYDYQDLKWCLTGPVGVAAAGCEPGDFDGDGDVDLLDWGFFQTVFTGP